MTLFSKTVQGLWKGLAIVLVVSFFVLQGQQSAPTDAQSGTVTQTANTVLPTFDTGLVSLEPWRGTKRFTMLVMGLDKRPSDTGTAFHTDSMILVSLDPKSATMGLLSIPRDLYVPLAQGAGTRRINDAYFVGETQRIGGGPELAIQTVQLNFGMHVDSYLVFDFEAVVKGVNAIGGIDIDVPTAIDDPQYPDMNNGYDPLHIPAGPNHLDGDLALKYARTRHHSSDIERARRQQQVIIAIRDRILNENMMPGLIVRAPGIWLDLRQNIHSGLPLHELLQLALYAKDIPAENIRQGVLDYHYVTSAVVDGADVLVPNQAAITGLLASTFGADYSH